MNRDEEQEPVDEPLPAPGYTGGDIVLVVMAILFTWLMAGGMLIGSGLFAWIVPDGEYLARSDRPETTSEKDKTPRPGELTRTRQALGQLAGPVAFSITEPRFYRALAMRLQVWAEALSFPIQLVFLWLLTVVRLGISPTVYGLSLARPGRSIGLALVAWLVLTPSLLVLNNLITSAYTAWMQTPEQVHPMSLLTQVPLYPIEWIFWVLMAVAIHPILEEFVFRGLLQAYVLAVLWRGYLVLAVAIFVVTGLNAGAIGAVEDQPGWRKLDAYMPVLFVLLLGAGFLAAIEFAPTSHLPGYIAVSMLFAAVHSTWPHPVALFVLSMGLCHLRERSGSLLTPVLVHGLFNATSVTLYFLS